MVERRPAIIKVVLDLRLNEALGVENSLRVELADDQISKGQ
jgi:hypothetical protein